MKLIKLSIFICLNLYSCISLGKDYVQVGCSIFSEDGNLMYKFTEVANMCHFFDDGRVLYASNNEIGLMGNNSKKIWFKNGYFHHQFKISRDGLEVFALTHHKEKIFSRVLQEDGVAVYRIKDGKKQKELKLNKFIYDLFIDSENVLVRGKIVDEDFLPDFEITHVNSLYEIPLNSLGISGDARFSEGNWIVNVPRSRLFIIFNRNLDKLLFKVSYAPFAKWTHDIQFTKTGQFVAYLNDNSSKRSPYTSINFFKLSKDKKSLEIDKEIVPKIKNNFIYQPWAGGFDTVNGSKWAISFYTKSNGYQVGLFNDKINLINSFEPFVGSINGEIFQECKFINAEKFLKSKESFL